MKKNILVLNMGMKSIRCIVFNSSGRKLSSSSQPLSTAINAERVEQDPVEWWNKAVFVIKQAYYESGISHIDYITVTASASCLVCVNREGNAVGNCLMVSDRRAVKEAEEIAALPEYKCVFENTGLAMSVSLLLPKILWIKKHRPEIFETTDFFLTPNDYLINKLSGLVVTDELNALKYHYSILKREYPLKLLACLGISRSKLPGIVETGVNIGKILPSVALCAGINPDAEVVVTSYDAICSFVGSGACEEGEASDVSGTVTVFRTLSNKNCTWKSNKVYSTLFRQGAYNIVGGSNNLGGGLVEWVKQCYYAKEEYPYEVMEKEAGESEIGAGGIIFLPYLLGERAPLWDDKVRGAFLGLERMHTRKDMTRAVFESTAFIDKGFQDAISEVGIEVSSVRVSGGLARINRISQIKADVLGKDVLVLSEFETTAAGAAMLVLHGQGVFASLKEAAACFAAVRMIVKPDMQNHEKYSLMYSLFKEAYEVNRPLFADRLCVLERIRRDRETRIENL